MLLISCFQQVNGTKYNYLMAFCNIKTSVNGVLDRLHSILKAHVSSKQRMYVKKKTPACSIFCWGSLPFHLQLIQVRLKE